MITYFRSVFLPSADTVVPTVRAYNAFSLELSESHPYPPAIVQKETKPDNQQECEDVQKPSGHVRPGKRRKLVKGRHDRRPRVNKATKQCRLRFDQKIVELKLSTNGSSSFSPLASGFFSSTFPRSTYEGPGVAS